MESNQELDQFVSPALTVAGLRLWIHGRQFPEAQDYWDGNWLCVAAQCASDGASVWASGAILMVPDIERWAAECERLYDRLAGEASLQPCEPNLRASIRSSDRLGHMTLCVEITPDHMAQQHRFEFPIDQSHLPALVSQCQAIVAEYPVRGERNLI